MINHTCDRPVNKMAARVLNKGVTFTPEKKIQTQDQPTPLAMKPIPKGVKDLTGNRRGRLTVIGFFDSPKIIWVVRCDCGMYTARRNKAILNKNNEQDRCEECRHLAHLKRTEVYRTTGKDQFIGDF